MLSMARLPVARATVFVPRAVQVPIHLPLLNELGPPTPPPKLIDRGNKVVQLPRTHHHGTMKSSRLFKNLFSQLKSPTHLFEARRLHALLIVNGFFHPASTDSVFGSQLVNIYVKFGCFTEALLVFDKLRQKNNIAWNAILRGFVGRSQFFYAIHFYYFMLDQGIAPDNFTYTLVLKACSGLSALEEGRRVLEFIQFNEALHDLQRSIFVECALISMFAKCGSLIEARQLFEEMPKKDLASWSAIISGSVQNGEWLEALRLFKRMRLVGIWPDSVTVASALPACARLEARHTGMALHGCAVRSGFESDLYVSNALIDMYCKCGETLDANFIFCNMAYRDAVSWSTLIAGYAQNCLYYESFQLFLQMKGTGVTTNAITVASVLPGLANLKLLKQGKEMHGYILKQGFESDAVVGSALIDMYTKCRSMREAEHIFQTISERHISVWNPLIVGYISHGDTGSASRIFRQVWRTELRPNSVTLVSILPLCAKMGTLAQGKEIHGYATKSSLVEVVSVGNSLIDTYCKCGHLELGIKVFNQMVVKNMVTYNTVISAHGIHGLGEQAISFFEQMKEERIRPNKVTFIALLSACSHAGLTEKGWLLYNSMMADYGIRPETEHYCCMVDLLGKEGNVEDALNFIERMPFEPDINVLGSLLGACRVHNKLELAELIGKKILQKDLNDSGYYVLLANIFASTKRWEDMSKVRTIIKQKYLTKKPGSSWIQLGSCIHIFHARGITHPQLNKIQEILKRLSFEMKFEGYMPDETLLSNDLAVHADELINLDAE